MPSVSILNSKVFVAGVKVVTLGSGFARTKFTALLIGSSEVCQVGVRITFKGNLNTHPCRGQGASGPRVIFGDISLEKAIKIQAFRRLGLLLYGLGCSTTHCCSSQSGEANFSC